MRPSVFVPHHFDLPAIQCLLTIRYLSVSVLQVGYFNNKNAFNLRVIHLNLTFACHDYDHVRDIFEPEVVTEGVELTQLKLQVEEIFFRFIKFGEFEVSEHSFAKYVSLRSKGQARGVAIPVFPSRVFRHSAIYVRSDSDIKTPKDLEGRRVGIPEWGQTAGVYVRGALADQFDVDLGSITWVQSGVHQPGRAEKVKFNLPDWVNLQPDTQHNLNDLLLSGAVDAVITPPDTVIQRQRPPCRQDV